MKLRMLARLGGSTADKMKTLILFVISATLLACNHTPPRGDDPARRDSTGDPIHPMDTTVERLNPDSVSDTPEVRF